MAVLTKIFDLDQGPSQTFVSKGDKTGGLGTEVPQQGPGAEPRWGLGRSPQKLKTYANNHSDNVLTKATKFFFSMGISGGHIPLVPPSLRP